MVFWKAAAVCALLGVAAAEPKVMELTFRKEAHADSLRARADAAHALRTRATAEVSLGNVQLLYYANMTIGSSGQEFVLQVDTGSSDIWVPWVGSNACQVRRGAYCAEFGAFDPTTSTSFNRGSPGFRISYVDGSTISGDYVSDDMAFGGIQLQNVTFGLARTATRALGIMGIGYSAGESIANTCRNCIYPNVIDQMVLQGKINTRAYSLWLNDLDADYGSILFGGIDTAKYSGSLIALPVLPDSRSRGYTSFGVALTSVTFKSSSGATDYQRTGLSTPVILDSGTTLTYLPPAIANDIIGGVGAFASSGTYLVPCSVGRTGASVDFNFGGPSGPTISINIGQFVLPILDDNGRSPALRDGTVLCQWGIHPSEAGTPNLFGDTFLRSTYVVYDLEHNIIAIAPAVFNTTRSNIVEIQKGQSNLPGVSSTATATASGLSFSGVPLQTAAGTITAGGALPSNRVSGTFTLGGSAASGTARPSGAASFGFGDVRKVLAIAAMVGAMVVGGGMMVLA